MQFFRAAVVYATFVMTFPLIASGQQQANDSTGIVVQPAIRVSPRGAGPHFWWTIAGSPYDSRKLLICALRNEPDIPMPLQAVLYGSEDGGMTWRTLFSDSGLLPTSEVSCAFGRGRTIYFISSRGLSGLGPSQLTKSDKHRLEQAYLRRSTDFGVHWRIAPPQPYVDSAVLVVQPGSAPNRDQVAIFTDDANNVAFARAIIVSHDGAQTLGTGGIQLPDVPTHIGARHVSEMQTRGFMAWLGGAARLPDGTLGAVYSDHPSTSKRPANLKLYVTFNRVSPSGKPLGTPIVIAPLNVTPPSFSNATQPYYEPSIAVGVVPHTTTQRTYVAWNDVRHGHLRVLLASSDNSGQTWTSPRIVDDIPLGAAPLRGTSAAFASIAVNSAGIVGVDWAEFGRRCWRFAASRDGGVMFGHSVAINSCALHPLAYTEYLGADFLMAGGDPAQVSPSRVDLNIDDWRVFEQYERGTGLVADADASFHTVWAAVGDGGDTLYSSRIDVDNEELEALANRRRQIIADALAESNSSVHSAAWLNYTQLTYDEGSGEFTIGAVLVQRRGTDVKWPVVLRLHSTASRLGPLHAVNADNGLLKQGAAWVFDGPDERLPAGTQAALAQRLPSRLAREYSEPRILRFRLDRRARQLIPASLLLLNAEFDVLSATR